MLVIEYTLPRWQGKFLASISELTNEVEFWETQENAPNGDSIWKRVTNIPSEFILHSIPLIIAKVKAKMIEESKYVVE